MNWIKHPVNLFISTNNVLAGGRRIRFLSEKKSGIKNSISSHFVNVGKIKLHYVKAGQGPHTLLFLPGGLGSGMNHFRHQLENFNAQKFTMIAWDPPGYGYSRPPERIFDNYFRKDADLVELMMHELNCPKYSVLGWSAGGITGLILAANAGNKHVQKLVVWGAASYVTQGDRESTSKYQNSLENWGRRFVEMNEKLYGPEEFRRLAHGMFAYFMTLDDICIGDLSRITCPTLILHGDKDDMITSEHPEYLLKKISNSVLYRFPEGKHNLHATFVDEFNSVVQEFLKTT